MKVKLPLNTRFDHAIKFCTLLALFESFFNGQIASLILFVTGTLLLVRWILWKPLLGFKNFGIAVSYIGFLGLITHLFFEAHRRGFSAEWVGSPGVHIFSFLCMGMIIPGMFIRIAQGHTGRKLQFTLSDRWAYASMGLAGFCRLVLTQIWPAQYVVWIGLAAILWSLCFLLLAMRLMSFLWQPRIDGREH